MNTERIILGVDPGLSVSGYSIMRFNSKNNTILLLEYGELKQSSKHLLTHRVATFLQFFEQRIKTHGVSELALETPFLGKNAQNFLKLGYLRGILYYLTHIYQLTLHEYAPRTIKRTITGSGNADKYQVLRALQQLFPAIKTPKTLDASDAIAITLCGVWESKQSLK